MMSNCNQLSEKRLERAKWVIFEDYILLSSKIIGNKKEIINIQKLLYSFRKEMAAHKEMILQMKADLEFSFRRIRLFKNALATKYPTIYKEGE